MQQTVKNSNEGHRKNFYVQKRVFNLSENRLKLGSFLVSMGRSRREAMDCYERDCYELIPLKENEVKPNN